LSVAFFPHPPRDALTGEAELKPVAYTSTRVLPCTTLFGSAY